MEPTPPPTASAASAAAASASVEVEEELPTPQQQPTTHDLARAFAAYGLTTERVQTMPFQQLMIALRWPTLLEACKALVERLLALSHADAGAEAMPPFSARIFLIMYPVAFHTRHVLEHNGPLEQALFAACVQLHGTFDALLRALLSPSREGEPGPQPQQQLLSRFREHVIAMRHEFDAWKEPDARKLTRRIVLSLVALYEAQARLDTTENTENAVIYANMDAQIARLRDKLVQIAGRIALDEFDAQRLTGLVVIEGAGLREVAAAAAAPQPGVDAVVLAEAEHRAEPVHEGLAHELLLDPAFELAAAADVGRQQGVGHIDDEAFWEALRREDLTPLLAAEARRATASGSVRLSVRPSSSEEEAEEAEALPQRLLQRLGDVLQRIREAFAALSPPPAAAAAAVAAAAAEAAVEAEAAAETVAASIPANMVAMHDVVYGEVLRRLTATRRVEFRLVERALTLTEMMVRSRAFHAPTHAAEQAEWRAQWQLAYGALQASDTVTDVDATAAAMQGALRLTLRWVNRLRVDDTNHRLRLIAGVVQEHGIDYERRKFEARLQNGSVSTVATRALVAQILLDADAETLTQARSGDPRAVHAVHRVLVLRALFDGDEPEILHLDRQRLDGMRRELLLGGAMEEEEDEDEDEDTALRALVTEAFAGRITDDAEALAFLRGAAATADSLVGLARRVPSVLALAERLTELAALNRSVHQALLATLVQEEAWRLLPEAQA